MPFRHIVRAAALVISAMAGSAAWAANPPALVSVCSSCHGEAGISPYASFPNIAGQNAGYIAYALRQYQGHDRTGAQAGIMAGVAAGLSASDIAALAAYYAGLKSP